MSKTSTCCKLVPGCTFMQYQFLPQDGAATYCCIYLIRQVAGRRKKTSTGRTMEDFFGHWKKKVIHSSEFQINESKFRLIATNQMNKCILFPFFFFFLYYIISLLPESRRRKDSTVQQFSIQYISTNMLVKCCPLVDVNVFCHKH